MSRFKKAKTENVKAFGHLIKANESLFKSRVSAIESYQQIIATYDDTITQLEESSKLRDELRKDSKDEQDIPMTNYQEYAKSLKRAQESYREQIRQYQSEQEKMPLEREKELQKQGKEQRRFTLAMICSALLALISLQLATYLMFFARPIGPPFGF